MNIGGRKCWIRSTDTFEAISNDRNATGADNISDWKLSVEGLAFTLAELAERDFDKFYEGTIFARAGYDEGFAAGVEEAAALVGAKKTVWVQGGCGYPVTNMLERDIRALLPPDYKSPAQIRREGRMEGVEAAIQWFDRHFPYINDCGALEEMRRALAEAEGGA